MKLTVLHTETLKKWGGQQNRVLLEAVGLLKRGHRVIVACHKGSALAGKSEEAGLRVYEVDMVKQAYLKTIPRLIKIIKSERVDIVSTHSSVDSWAGGLAARMTGRRLVRFRHNLYPIGKDPLTKLIYSLPDLIIAVSDTVADVLMQCGLNKQKMRIIPDSVDIEKFDPVVEDLRKELNIPHDMLVIGNTSTFSDVKGQEYLLRAFNSIYPKTPCLLLFAGRLIEPAKGMYLSNVREDLRDRVIFLGHRDDVPAVLKTIDVFVYPSILEGLGTALLEAMAMARPVVVSDIPTFRSFIKDNCNGIYFRNKDAEDMSAKVVALLNNKALRERLAANARSTALEKFTLDRMMDLTELRYREVIGAV